MIYLSNFATWKNKPGGVSIAAITPRRFTGDVCKDLAPPWSLVKAFKAGKITDAEFITEYGHQIYTLDFEKIAADMDGKTLLCYCDKNALCHRSLLALFLYNELGTKFEEREGFGELFTVPFEEVGNPLEFTLRAEDVEKYSLQSLLLTVEEKKELGLQYRSAEHIILNKWLVLKQKKLLHLYRQGG